MSKYHISKSGKPTLCRATKRPCPLGEHFNTEQEAYEHVQKEMSNEFGVISTLNPNNAFKKLKNIINIEDITSITTHSASLAIPETVELLKTVNIEELNKDLTFWTKDYKVVIEETDVGWSSEIDLLRINLKPAKGLIEVTPESVTEVWKDPETGKDLPFKTEAYHNRQNEIKQERIQRSNKETEKYIQRITKKTEENKAYFNNLPIVNVDPFSIIKGGKNNNCRYIILPKDFPMSKMSYGLIGSFYNDMDSELRETIDFSGYAAIVNDEITPITRYELLNTREEYSDEQNNALNEYNNVYKLAEENGHIVKIVGFSIESTRYKNLLGTLDEIAENVKMELEKLR